MKIEIKSIELRNFKKIREQKIDFSHNMLISGGNKVGKTTIYDAYLWAIFGVTSKKKGIVQPLDVNNEIIHHLETSVTVVLEYNNEREIKIQRILTENWKNKGAIDEKLQSKTQECLINDVPLSQKGFSEKLEELCPLDKWMILSNINIFMSYKIDDRRRMLMSLAGEINEEELMKPYPIVYEGVVKERKELSEMLLQQSKTKKKANDELELIPAKIQAQDALRVMTDFSELKTEKANIDSQIKSIDASLEGVSEKDPAMERYLSDVQAHNIEVTKAQTIWQNAKIKAIDDLTKKISDASNALSDANKNIAKNLEAYKNNKVKLTEVKLNFDKKLKEWNDVNEKEFDYEQTDVCPVCGRPYTDEMKEEEYNNAVKEFNAHKSQTLVKLQNEASEFKQQMVVLKGNINTYEQITKDSDEKASKNAEEEYDKLIEQRQEKQNQTWEMSAEKVSLDKEYEKIEASKPQIKTDATVEENKAKKSSLTTRRDEIMKQLADEETNKRIDVEKEKLSKRSVELAQIIADCAEAIRQIKAYRKAKITLIEEKVNSYFSLVRWKFYEQNITNDDEKEICTAIDKDGIDYDNTNDGTVIDMGVDIIGGISKALNIFVPLFIDRKESAEHIIPVEQQTIYLQCIYGQSLEIKSL